MILRRLLDEFRGGNLARLASELFVLVTGIFLGFQLDDWNEDRKERELETEYLERLLADASHNLAQSRYRGDALSERADRLLKVANTLEDGRTDGIDPLDVEQVFCFWYVVEDVGERTAAFDELVATGRIALIRDVELREQLQLTAATSVRAYEDSNMLNSVLPDKASLLQPFVSWHSAEHTRTETAVIPGTRCSADLDALSSDSAAISVLYELYRGEAILALIRGEQVEALEDLVTKLGDVIASR